MLQFDIEKCLEQCDGHFDLVLIASQRARELSLGQKPKVERNGNKNSLLSLRELADQVLNIEELRESLISRLKNDGVFLRDIINKDSNVLEEVNSINFLASENELSTEDDTAEEMIDTSTEDDEISESDLVAEEDLQEVEDIK